MLTSPPRKGASITVFRTIITDAICQNNRQNDSISVHFTAANVIYSKSAPPIEDGALSLKAGHYSSSFDLPLKKYSFVSLATTPDRANTAMKFGMAMSPLKVSAMSHTTSIDETEPITTTMMKAT